MDYRPNSIRSHCRHEGVILIFIRKFSFRFTHSIFFEKDKADAAKDLAKEGKENAEGKKKLIEEKKKKQEEAKKKLEDAEKDADAAKDKVSCVQNECV